MPSFVAEILQPESVEHDRITKRHLYEKVGVREYWIVDRYKNVITQLILNENRYAAAELARHDLIRSTVLGAFGMNVGRLFGLE